MESNSEASQLIFVAGFARSGTTWVSNVINSHPDVLYRHEFFGRCYQLLGDELFRKLKFGFGLDEGDYVSARRILISAHVDTDKPPFFKKRFRPMVRPPMQKGMWLLGKLSPVFVPIYRGLFTPRDCRGIAIVVKETGTAIWLESLMAGMRCDKLIVIVRHPYGVIASHLIGRKAGLMPRPDKEFRRIWFKDHSAATYLRSNGIDWKRVAGMPEVEFMALNWRVQNDDYLRIHASHPRSMVLSYEAFVNDATSQAREVLRFLGLSTERQVFQFIRMSTSGKSKLLVGLGNASSEYYSVVRTKDLDTEKWNQTLCSNDLMLIDRHAAALIKNLGLDRWMPRSSERCVN